MVDDPWRALGRNRDLSSGAGLLHPIAIDPLVNVIVAVYSGISKRPGIAGRRPVSVRTDGDGLRIAGRRNPGARKQRTERRPGNLHPLRDGEVRLVPGPEPDVQVR